MTLWEFHPNIHVAVRVIVNNIYYYYSWFLSFFWLYLYYYFFIFGSHPSHEFTIVHFELQVPWIIKDLIPHTVHKLMRIQFSVQKYCICTAHPICTVPCQLHPLYTCISIQTFHSTCMQSTPNTVYRQTDSLCF